MEENIIREGGVTISLGAKRQEVSGLEEYLREVSERLNGIKAKLLEETESLKTRVEQYGNPFSPSMVDKIVLPSFLALQYFSGILTSPLQVVRVVAIYGGINVIWRKIDSRKWAKRLAVAGENLAGISQMLEELKETLAAVNERKGSIKNGLTEGSLDEAGAALENRELADELALASRDILERYKKAMAGSTYKDVIFAPVIPKKRLDEINANILKAESIEDLALIQKDLLADSDSVDNAQIRQSLNRIETKAVAEIVSAISAASRDSRTRTQAVAGLRDATPAGHIDLNMALEIPGVRDRVRFFKEAKEAATFAVGSRILAWRKLFYTTKINLQYISLYVAEITKDAVLSEEEKESLKRELRAKTDGMVEGIIGEIAIKVIGDGSHTRSAGDDKYLRGYLGRQARKEIPSDFDSWHALSAKYKATERDSKGFIGQINLWSQGGPGVVKGPSGRQI